MFNIAINLLQITSGGGAGGADCLEKENEGVI